MSTLEIDERRLGRDVYLPDDATAPLRVTPTGDLQLVEGRDNLNGALRRRLVCSPGELLHRPGYGVGLLEHVETANSPTSRALIANKARRNLLADPRLSEAKVSAALGLPGEIRPTAEALTLTLDVTLAHDRSRATLQTTFEV
jgi:phage baseplate assembly protein W